MDEPPRRTAANHRRALIDCNNVIIGDLKTMGPIALENLAGCYLAQRHLLDRALDKIKHLESHSDGECTDD